MGSKISKNAAPKSGRKSRKNKTERVPVKPADSGRQQQPVERGETGVAASRETQLRVIDLEYDEEEVARLWQENSDQSSTEVVTKQNKKKSGAMKKLKKKKKEKERASVPQKLPVESKKAGKLLKIPKSPRVVETPKAPPSRVQRLPKLLSPIAPKSARATTPRVAKAPQAPKTPQAQQKQKMVEPSTGPQKKPVPAARLPTPQMMRRKALKMLKRNNRVTPFAPVTAGMASRGSMAGLPPPVSRCSTYLDSTTDDEAIPRQNETRARSVRQIEDRNSAVGLKFHDPVQEIRLVMDLMAHENRDLQDVSAMLSIMERASREVVKYLVKQRVEQDEAEERQREMAEEERLREIEEEEERLRELERGEEGEGNEGDCEEEEEQGEVCSVVGYQQVPPHKHSLLLGVDDIVNVKGTHTF